MSVTSTKTLAKLFVMGGIAAAPFAIATAAIAAPAFPGATGHGKNVTGGRGGRVCQVTNLNNSGAGSLRGCLDQTGPRTVVFRKSGTITLTEPLRIRNGDVTVAGQTAPAQGVQIRIASTGRGPTLYVYDNNVIIRHMKFRPGTAGTNRAVSDCVTMVNTENVYLDSVSCAFAYDEGINAHNDLRLVTVANTIVGPSVAPHSKGSLWCSESITRCGQITEALNLYFTNRDRNPNYDGRGGATYKFDAVNNYFYNPYSEFAEIHCTWSGGVATNGTHANFVGNIFQRGPASIADRNAFNIYPNEGTTCRPRLYQSGNELGYRVRLANRTDHFSSTPIGTLSVTPMSTTSAKAHIKSRVGAFWWNRDALDARIVADTFAGRGPSAIISSPSQYVGIPTLPVQNAPADYDRDGMSDQWERENGLNPSVADNNGDADRDGYTNLEEYLAVRANGDQR